MPHTYVSDLVHCVFSTKERRRLISSETQPALWSFIGGIARKNGFKALIVGGTEDHVVSARHHVLGQSRTTAEGLIFPVDEPDSHQGIFLAGGLWRIYARCFSEAAHH